MRTFFVFCCALGTCCFLAAQTYMPSAPGESAALSGNGTNGLTEIRSDNGGEFYYKLKTYIYRGNVRVDNPQMKLTCELLTIESPEFEQGKFNRATAETNVVIDWMDESGTNHATADKAVYTYVLTNLATLPEVRWQTNATVVLTGNPYVVGGRGTFRGDPINWDRVNDVISSPNALDMTIKQDKSSNAPTSPFDTTTPKSKPAPKPK